MSITVLKTIELLAILIDHVAVIFWWQGWNVLSFDTTVLRSIGRISFPTGIVI